MLKIKDNVDLKELEKYGFEVKNHFNEEDGTLDYQYARYKLKNNIINFAYNDIKLNCVLSINSNYKTLGFGVVTSKFEYECWKLLIDEVIYDLIKDGLVEKVEE